ncbi:MAG: DUF3418 domain-containing protein, partial [Opitutales bacterium]
DLRGLVPKLGDWLQDILMLRLALQTHQTPYPGLENDLGTLLPPDFLRRTPFTRVSQLPRYLRGMQGRADRWKRDPAKDASRARELQPFVRAVSALSERRAGGTKGDRVGGAKSESVGGHRPPLQDDAIDSFRWLVEEFRVSLFAQELGTAEPVSAVRLERVLREAAAGQAEATGAAPAPPKPLALPVTGKRVLKSLDALGNLPR